MKHVNEILIQKLEAADGYVTELENRLYFFENRCKELERQQNEKTEKDQKLGQQLRIGSPSKSN